MAIEQFVYDPEVLKNQVPPGVDSEMWARAVKELRPGQEREVLADTFEENLRPVILRWLEENPDFQPKPRPTRS